MMNCKTCHQPLLGGTYCATHEQSRLQRLKHWLRFTWLAIRFSGPSHRRFKTDDMEELDRYVEDLEVSNGRAREVMQRKEKADE